MRKVIEQINTYYSDAKNICDIGSGFGFMTRCIARYTKANVIGLENVRFSALVSNILNMFSFGKVKTIRCDAYEYLSKTKKIFDVGIAYLGPKEVQNLKKYKQKMRVLICLDFEIYGLRPVRIVDVGHGFTYFNHKKYPHKLFIYEFK
jgi:tRNA A22 N-methylase